MGLSVPRAKGRRDEGVDAPNVRLRAVIACGMGNSHSGVPAESPVSWISWGLPAKKKSKNPSR